MGAILIFVADGYEDLELQYPKYRLLEAGFKVAVAGENKEKTYKGYHGYPCKADITLDEVSVDDYVGLVIPGGYAPDHLRTNSLIKKITKEFDEKGKMIAFICHAGWIPISAGIIRGVTCTSYPAIKDDMENAGASWIDEAVVIDRHFISSRSPKDLPKFMSAIIEYLNAD